jgi:lysophospholipid acyltransferase (LPLAT)-like uncharacterized protein
MKLRVCKMAESGLGHGAPAGIIQDTAAQAAHAAGMSEPERTPPPPAAPPEPSAGEEGMMPEGENAPEPAQKRSVRTVTLLTSLAILPVYWVARAWLATLRMRISEEERGWLADTRQTLIVVVWHNRLFITSEIRRRYRNARPMVGLVSASADGAWLAEYFRKTGIGAVRGSTSWRGAQAVRELLAVMKGGSDIAITPDGPRGPCYEVQPGALAVARLLKAPLLLISARFESAWRLRSWDGFYLPKPFSKVELRIKRVVDLTRQSKDNPEAASSELQRQLREMTVD